MWEVLQAVSQLLFIAMLSHLRLPIKLIDVNLETFSSFFHILAIYSFLFFPSFFSIEGENVSFSFIRFEKLFPFVRGCSLRRFEYNTRGRIYKG